VLRQIYPTKDWLSQDLRGPSQSPKLYKVDGSIQLQATEPDWTSLLELELTEI
jgi:hypothetical protein